jgi:HUS1 checkpoint protein
MHGRITQSRNHAEDAVGSFGDNSRNATSLTDADVSLKLNKRVNQPVWAFEIKGRVSATAGCLDTT